MLSRAPLSFITSQGLLELRKRSRNLAHAPGASKPHVPSIHSNTAVRKSSVRQVRARTKLHSSVPFLREDRSSTLPAVLHPLPELPDVDRTGSGGADGHQTIMLICWSRLDQCELLKRTSSNASR